MTETLGKLLRMTNEPVAYGLGAIGPETTIRLGLSFEASPLGNLYETVRAGLTDEDLQKLEQAGYTYYRKEDSKEDSFEERLDLIGLMRAALTAVNLTGCRGGGNADARAALEALLDECAKLTLVAERKPPRTSRKLPSRTGAKPGRRPKKYWMPPGG
ncbi:MAG TPA: hypothetical protein VF597_00395 [Candidatus Saccharimonadales bacterium]|jgi:hypothetical protein